MQVATPKKGYKLVKTSFGKYEEIPEEWEFEDFKKLVFFQEGPGLLKGQFGTSGTPFLNIRTITNKGIDKSKCQFVKQEEFEGRYEHFLLDENDIVMSSSGTLGKTTTIKKSDLPLMLNTSTIRLRPNDEKLLDRKFLHNFLHTEMFKKQIMLMNTGSAILNFGPSHLNKMKMFYPELKEQQKIASILSNVDDTIQKTDQIIEQTQRLKKGMMQKLFTRGIGHTKFKKVKWLFGKEIEIPQSWEMTELEKCVDPETIITYGIVQAGDNISNGIPYVRTNDMLGDVIPIQNLFHTTHEIHKKYKRTQLKKGDIICTVRASVGKFHIVPEELDKANLSRGIARISPRNNLDNVFLYFSLQSNLVKEQLNALAKGSTFLEITMFQLRKILTPISTNIQEQQQIASILSNIDAQIGKEKLHKSNLERLKKGLMQKLLTGQIRVKVP